jgi:hypothetical protein
MKQILPDEIKVGDNLSIEQSFEAGYIHYIGKVVGYGDEYVYLNVCRNVPINLHPHVGMPNVLIYRINS